jgi:hypothetical protein
MKADRVGEFANIRIAQAGARHRSRHHSKSSGWLHDLTACPHRQELDLRKIHLTSAFDAFLGAIEMTVIAAGAAVKGLLA